MTNYSETDIAYLRIMRFAEPFPEPNDVVALPSGNGSITGGELRRWLDEHSESP